ncbi:MAG: CTP synthase [Patescibacteria group bacterium]|jgi:CTP synthase
MVEAKKKTNFIFVCGGVLSGLGKGIVTSSIGAILKERGFSVTAVKIDPYISIDAGTMRPAEHGEVFVTEDGGEIDQDLGNYERFLDISLSKANNITTGKVYQQVIDNERAFKYGGRDAELFPDIINEVKRMILANVTDEDFCMVEIGGTTGDLENKPFLYAAMDLSRDYKSVFIMVTYLPFLRNVGELKTKPTQHAVARLTEIGIFPDLLITRNEIPIDKPRVETISKRCFIPEKNIIDDPDTDCIYEIPLVLERSNVTDIILEKVGIVNARKSRLKDWENIVNTLRNPQLKKVKVALVGKYIKNGSSNHNDVYISVCEALKHAAVKNNVQLDIVPISSEQFEEDPKSVSMLKDFDGVVVPQGWGSRGTEGKIAAIRYIRERKIPYLGLCFGMQMAVIEFARNVCGLKNANSEEADPDTSDPVIHIMPDQKEYLAKGQYGGTIRLGAWPCKVMKDTILFDSYRKTDISERHRHRYEFNNDYKEAFEKKGMIFSGTSPDGELVEAIELPKETHPFFVGVQFHPEYKSRVISAHPLFTSFISVCKDKDQTH